MNILTIRTIIKIVDDLYHHRHDGKLNPLLHDDYRAKKYGKVNFRNGRRYK